MIIKKFPSNEDVRFYDADVAKDVGIGAAVIFQKICEWHEANKEKGFELYNFSAIANIQKYLPDFTYRQIYSAITKLKSLGYITEGKTDYNKANISDFCKSKKTLQKSKNSTIKEKPFPHTPYKKKDKEEYLLSSESDNKLSSSSDNNIQNLNNFFPPIIPQVPAEPSQKEKKEVLQTQKKDVFEEFFTNTIYREWVMKNYGVDEKTLDYCINQARKKSSCMIDGVTRREAQFKLKYELDNIPVVKGKLFDRKQAFYNEILNCANQQNLDRDFATWFYCKWSQLAIPELDIMMFEKEAKDRSWDTFRVLKMSFLSYKKKNEKYY